MTLPIEPSSAPVLNQIIGAVGITLVAVLTKLVRDVRNDIRIYRDEHDILWEDYNERKGLTWRRHMGRGRTSPRKANGAAAGMSQ